MVKLLKAIVLVIIGLFFLAFVGGFLKGVLTAFSSKVDKRLVETRSKLTEAKARLAEIEEKKDEILLRMIDAFPPPNRKAIVDQIGLKSDIYAFKTARGVFPNPLSWQKDLLEFENQRPENAKYSDFVRGIAVKGKSDRNQKYTYSLVNGAPQIGDLTDSSIKSYLNEAKASYAPYGKILPESPKAKTLEKMNAAILELGDYYLACHQIPTKEKNFTFLFEPGHCPSGYYTTKYLREIPRDGWGREIHLDFDGGMPRVSSFGQDGKAGGEGDDADMVRPASLHDRRWIVWQSEGPQQQMSAVNQVLPQQSLPAIQRPKAQCAIKNLGEILQQIRMVPVRGGFRVSGVAPNSVWEKAGFKIDDVVVRLNGLPYTTPSEAMKAWNESDGVSQIHEILRGEGHITLKLPCSQR